MKILVKDMHCARCEETIRRFLDEINGIKKLEFNLDSRIIEIDFNAPADENSIIEAILDAGFEAEKI